MSMRQSKLFNRTLKKPPKEAESISHKLLLQADFIDSLASGIYSFLPLGFRVYQKIEKIIREEMNKISGQEVFLPALQPKKLWLETNRWKTIDPPLFKVRDRHGKELALGSTHEEVIVDLIRSRVRSYRDLPLALYQIQNKFRNEIRATAGLLRVREFVMKDLYSCHESFEDLDRYYQEVSKTYKRIYKKCGLQVLQVEAFGGTIGGKETHEFMVLAEVGEDRISLCSKCNFACNMEVAKKIYKGRKTCPKCGSLLLQKNGIEVGHIFKLGTEYSEKMKAKFIDRNGKEKFVVMGCYGIGLGRLLACVVEVSHDEKGIIWPYKIAPFSVHLISLQSKDNKVAKFSEDLYQTLQRNNIEVLYDDREDKSPGEKLKDCDLIGIPLRVVVSKKTVEKGACEFKLRKEKEAKLISRNKIIGEINETLKNFSV